MKKNWLSLLILLLLHQVSDAQITFQKAYGDTSGELGLSVELTNDGGYIVAGSKSSYGQGDYYIYLLKTDSVGDTLWTKTIGGTGICDGLSVKQTNDGGYIVVGALKLPTTTDSTILYLVKTNSVGDTLWTKAFGKLSYNFGAYVEVTSDGGYIICGNTSNYGGGSNSDMYVIKTDSIGDTQWTRTYGSTESDGGDEIHETNDGGYIIAGSTRSFGVSGADYYLVKIDGAGNVLWSKTFGGIYNEFASSVQQTSDNGFIIAGTSTSFGTGNYDYDFYVVKTDSTGDLVWSRTYGAAGEDHGVSGRQTYDGGYIFIGHTHNFGAGYIDVYLIKADAFGDTTWTKTFGGTKNDIGYSVQQTPDSGYILTGYTASLGVSIYIGAIYLIKTDAYGISGCNEGGTSTIVGTPVSLTSSPVTSNFPGGILTESPFVYVGNGATVTTVCTILNANEYGEIDNDVLIYPNPSDGLFTILFDEQLNDYKIKIFNLMGETVFESTINANQNKEINLKALSKGIFVVKVFDNKNVYFKKIIIE